MIAKYLLDQLLRYSIRRGSVQVTYWDGQRLLYGASYGPQVSVTVKSPEIIWAALRSVSLAFGEGYMEGHIEVTEDELEALFELVALNRTNISRPRALDWLTPNARNRRDHQRDQVRRHYDVGNDYYRLFLDPTLSYSCAYFERPDDSLEKAQLQKIRRLLRKLQLKPGQLLLDIGCGWGHLAVLAAQEYGVKVLGITLSSEQLESARQLAQRKDVAGRVRFELMNYQDLTPERQFDRVISVGMFEHVGRRQRARYFRQVTRLLKNGGVSVLHTITADRDRPLDAWIDRYIFPGGSFPTLSAIEAHLESLGLWSIDRENLWQHYARTLELWRESHRMHRDRIIAMFDERFYRMRDFWLAGSIGGFKFGGLGLAQIIFTKGDTPFGKPPYGTWPWRRSDYLGS